MRVHASREGATTVFATVLFRAGGVYATQVFNGADSIFRGILVPIFGLKAQLLRRDARVLAEETTKGLTEEQKAAVVASFNEGVAKKTN